MLKIRLNLRKVIAIAICLVVFSVSDVLAQTSTTDKGVVINGVKSGSEWTTVNDKSGRKFGTDKNILFLPATGFRNKNGVVSVGKVGYYWSGTPYDHFAYCLNFDHKILFPADYYNRNSGGLSVRCVKIINK